MNAKSLLRLWLEEGAQDRAERARKAESALAAQRDPSKPYAQSIATLARVHRAAERVYLDALVQADVDAKECL